MNAVKEKILKMDDEQLTALIQKLAEDEYFIIEPNELDFFKKDFLKNINGFDALDQIDTTNIQPLSYPIVNKSFYLRNDENFYEINSEDWLKQVKHDENNYMEVEYVKQ